MGRGREGGINRRGDTGPGGDPVLDPSLGRWGGRGLSGHMLASDSSPALPPVRSETLRMAPDLSGPLFPHVHSWVMRAPAWRDGDEGGRKTHPWEGALSEN